MERKIIGQAVPENYDDERIKIFSSALLSNDNNWEYRIYTPSDRILFLEKFGEFCFPNVPVKSIMKQYHALPHDFLKIELWKQCVLATGLAQGYIDYHQVHILDDTYKLLESESSVIIRLPVEKSSGDHDKINTKYMVNTALIINSNEALISASQKMSRFLFETPISTWTSERMSSLLVGYEFYQALGDVSKLDVKWLEPKCQNMAEASSRNLHKEPIRFIDLDSSSDNTAVTLSFLPTNFCPNSANSPCCHVIISETETASTPIWFLLQHPLMASYDKDNESRQAYMLQKSPELKLVTVKPDEMDYISVVVPSDVDIAPDLDDNDAYQSMTPNFFQLLLENECLPTQKECHRCLQRASPEGESADCQKCANKCGCYCSVLCKLRPPPKRVAHRFTIHPPKLKRDVHRLIPKLVHQTWFEEVHSSKYPNMSRLMESWKISGWEYHF